MNTELLWELVEGIQSKAESQTIREVVEGDDDITPLERMELLQAIVERARYCY